MGVSGTGKTSVARGMSERLQLLFIEGDHHHPESNIAKMSSGVPLDDADREPWLRTLAGLVAEHDAEGTSTVLTCSALKRSYRDMLRTAVPGSEMFFIHLHAEFAVLETRMNQREGHFMPPSMLRSQFDTLEPLEPDEVGTVVDVSPALETVVSNAVTAVRQRYGDAILVR